MTTSKKPRLPDPETSKRLLDNVRFARLALEEVSPMLDELNERLQQDLEKQWSRSWSKRRQSVGLE